MSVQMKAEPKEGQRKTPAPTANMAKAQEMGQKAYGVTKEATGHAISAIRILLSDPMGGQGKALAMLGDAKALSAGLVFHALFSLAAFMFGNAFLFAPFKRIGADIGSGDYFKLAVLVLVPAAALWVGFTATAKLFKGCASHSANVFVTGVAMLPMALVLLGVSLLGGGNIELMAALGLFGATLTILLLNSALLDVVKLPTQKAVLLTPTLILATAYIAKVMTVTLCENFM